MKRLLESLVRPLVDEPDRVEVRERPEEGGLCLVLRVPPEERGRVIGRRGRTADALRTLLDAVAARRGLVCHLEIEE